MDAQHILAFIQSHAIRSVDDLHASGIETKLLGVGGGRQCYEIVGTGLVLKFRIPDTPSQNQREVANLKFLQQHSDIRDVLPEVLYYDEAADVLMMRKYEIPANNEMRVAIAQQILGRLRSAVPDWLFEDVNVNNTGLDASGKPRIFDLGIFRPKPTRFAK